MNMDSQGRMHLQVQPSDLPCDECGSLGPENRAWQLIGESGVLCRRCLSAWVEEVNRELGAPTPAPAEGYEAQTGDVFIQRVREDQWNLYQFMAHQWQYLFTISQEEVDTYFSPMPLIGETDGIMGIQRYYRPRHPVLYRPKRRGSFPKRRGRRARHS